MNRPVFIAHHARTGIAALNVVSAALDADARTTGLDVRFAPNREAVARAIEEARAENAPAIVGWSFYSTDFASMAADVVWVKAHAPTALHVAGGVHATAEPLETLRAGFDLVAIGEGEATIIAIVDAVMRDEDPRALRGTAHLDGDRLVSHGPGDRRPLDDFPALNIRYGKWNAMEITRGCVYACSFCQTPYMFKARFRHRSVANVRMHLDAMEKSSGPKFARFVSPTSLSYGSEDESVNLPKVEELLASVREAIGRGKLYFGTFPSEVRPEHVTHDALAMLAKYVDNTSLVIGGQSGSERLLREMRRGHGVTEIESAVRIAVEHGFRPDVDFLLGVPGETPEDRRLSIALAERLIAMGARIHSHAFLPLPGTPLRDRAPEAIEPAIAQAMAHMESRGAMYGQWRKQLVAAEALTARRRERRP